MAALLIEWENSTCAHPARVCCQLSNSSPVRRIIKSTGTSPRDDRQCDRYELNGTRAFATCVEMWTGDNQFQHVSPPTKYFPEPGSPGTGLTATWRLTTGSSPSEGELLSRAEPIHFHLNVWAPVHTRRALHQTGDHWGRCKWKVVPIPKLLEPPPLPEAWHPRSALIGCSKWMTAIQNNSNLNEICSHTIYTHIYVVKSD